MQKFLETATPQEIMEDWKDNHRGGGTLSEQGRRLNTRFGGLFLSDLRRPQYQPFRGTGNRINLLFLRLFHWLKFWWAATQKQKQDTDVATAALDWKMHWRVDPPHVWKGDEK